MNNSSIINRNKEKTNDEKRISVALGRENEIFSRKHAIFMKKVGES